MGTEGDLRGHIAIVDDDASVRRAMLRLCAAYSLRAKAYASAREFLVWLETEVPDCLIVDLQMPEMTGLQLLQHLAGSGPRIPSIVLTGNDEDGIRHRCELAGAAAFLFKPVSADTLISTIHTVVAADSDRKSSAVHREIGSDCKPL